MANKSKRRATRNTRPQINPLARQIRANPKPKLNFDGTVLNGISYLNATSTAANLGRDFHYVNTSVNQSICRVSSGLVSLYRQYKYRNVSLEWLPSVAPGVADAGSKIHVAYIDNPEMMVLLESFSAANMLNAIRGMRDARTFNAWERFTYRVPLTYRRKIFDVNTVHAPPDTSDIHDRTTQGMIVVAIESVSAAVVLGQYRFLYGLELHGLNTTVTV